MFGKLLKYDLSAMLRRLSSLYILAAAAWVAFYILVSTGSKKSNMTAVQILLAVCIALTFSVAAITLIRVIERYRGETYDTQAYFNMTLPASESEHLLSGALTDVITMIISGAICIIPSMFIMIYGFRKLYEYEGDMMSISELIAQNWKTLLLMLLITVAACFKLVFQIYLSISVGALVPRHHTLISILAFIGTEIVTGMCRKAMHITGALKFSIFSSGEEMTVNGSSDLSPESAAAAILFYAAFSVIFFLITRWLLKKHMNLE